MNTFGTYTRRVSFWIVALTLCATVGRAAAGVDVRSLANLPVLDNGRTKPIDTLARETVQFVTNRVSLEADTGNGARQKLQPLEVLLAWHDNAAPWEDTALIDVPNLELRSRLKMNPADKWITPTQLHSDKDFVAWIGQLGAKHAEAERSGEETKFTKLEDAAMDVAKRLNLFDSACDLRLAGIVPTNAPDGAWVSVFDLQTKSTLPANTAGVRDAWNSVQAAYHDGEQGKFDAGVGELKSQLKLLSGTYADQSRLDREVAYNRLQPFHIVLLCYVVVLMGLFTSVLFKKKWVYVAAMSLMVAAIAVHMGAFAFRCSITGWAPVTNIYETVIWVALAAAVFATVLELTYRRRTLAIGGATVAAITCMIADVMPPQYGQQLRNLTPVLRSNYWLFIHVLTIVSSYAAFALACVIGNIVLGQYLLKKRPSDSIRENLQFTYRAIQIGVLLVAAGTILGGLWADVSWGRFWGWDPKEVWALITLLAYLALLHGRFAGWVGPFGLAAGSVLCFCTVIMSWYGVNFILGVGLHAYGFGAGGGAYIGTYVVAQLLYVCVAKWIYSKRQRESAVKPTATDLPISGITPAGAH